MVAWALGQSTIHQSVEKTVNSVLTFLSGTHPHHKETAKDRTKTPVEREAGDFQDHQFFTPEEKILLIVSQHGGSIKQKEIVQQSEWSKSTVSRKLAALESSGQVTRVKLGRENHVYRAGSEPSTLQSPIARHDESVAQTD